MDEWVLKRIISNKSEHGLKVRLLAEFEIASAELRWAAISKRRDEGYEHEGCRQLYWAALARLEQWIHSTSRFYFVN
jgi:hypothetical protein